jgi:hypothetical protein
MSVYGRVDRNAMQIGRLNREEQRRTGSHVLYTPRRRCSCLHPLTRQPDLGCRVCDGVGWYWRGQDECQIRAIVQGAGLHRDLIAQGLVQPGDLVIQFDRPPRNLAPWDRVRLNPHGLYTLAIAAEAAVVVRADVELEEGEGDVVPYDDIQYRIARIFSIDQADPRSGSTVTYPASSYTVAPCTNRITWLADAPQPEPGTQYTVNYLVDWDWIVSEPVAPTALGAVGFQGKVALSRRMKDERHEQERARDAAPQDTEDDDIEELF